MFRCVSLFRVRHLHVFAPIHISEADHISVARPAAIGHWSDSTGSKFLYIGIQHLYGPVPVLLDTM